MEERQDGAGGTCLEGEKWEVGEWSGKKGMKMVIKRQGFRRGEWVDLHCQKRQGLRRG